MSTLPVELEEGEGKPNWVMKELKPKHRQICSMLAQGIPQVTIAQVVGVVPEYIPMLMRQPLIKQCFREYCDVAEVQLDAMFVQSVEAIGDTLSKGSYGDKMKAARLQLEATKRIGPRTASTNDLIDSNTRLTKLAEKLLYLQGRGSGEVLNMTKQEDGTYAQENS